jgi:hypothetical protein
MSTKRLSRTVLEAGQWRRRWHYSKGASRAERSAVRVRLAAARRDREEAEELYIRPRKKVHHMFARDKLGAAERWLFDQVGRPWARVASDIHSHFDTHTIPGRHLVREHLLPNHLQFERLDTGWTVNRRFVFHVDKHGILRARRRR